MSQENDNRKLNTSGRKKTLDARREIARQRIAAEKARRRRRKQIRIGIIAGATLLLIGLILFFMLRSKDKDGNDDKNTAADTTSVSEDSSGQEGQSVQEATESKGPWRTINGKTCYTDASGNPLINKIITDTDGQKYYLGEDGGLLVSANLLRDGKLYTADTSGVLSPASGWTEVNGVRYLAEDGAVVTDRIVTEDGTVVTDQAASRSDAIFYLDLSGKVVTDRLVSYGGYLYSAAADGTLSTVSGWQEQDGYSYYAENDGKLYISQYVTIDGDDYFMDQYGAVLHGTPTIDQYLGSAHLLNWMETHFNDYYLKTPYDGIWTHLDDPEALLRPYGEYGENGGMNCSGFISHLIQSTGGDLEKVNAMGLEGGFIDADSYLYLGLREYVQCRTYDSVEELLASGEAKKGDILYLYPDKSENEDADCHLGIFWGDTPSENKFWSQAQDTGCGVTEIQMLNPIKKIYLLPIDGR